MKTYIFTRIETFTVEIEAADELAAWDAVNELGNGDSDWLCIPDDTQISCDEKENGND